MVKVRCLFCGREKEMLWNEAYNYTGFCNQDCTDAYNMVIHESRKRKAEQDKEEKEEKEE